VPLRGCLVGRIIASAIWPPVCIPGPTGNLLIELRSLSYKAFVSMPGEGFEPPAFGLQNRCTTTVLTRQIQAIPVA
jgi:hypothetical protein